MKQSKQYPRCIFCNSRDYPPAREDVLAKWIAREFPGKDRARFTALHGRYKQQPTTEFKTVGHLGWITDGVCGHCNSGWMSVIENRAIPCFLPLMAGEPFIFTKDKAKVVAQWGVKTSMTWEYMRYASGRYFRPEDRRAFCESRTIPPHTLVILARYTGDPGTLAVGGPLQVSLSQTPGRLKAHCLTVVIKQMALQIICFRLKSYQEPLRTNVPREMTVLSRLIWPWSADVGWPPAATFDGQSIFQFTDFWLT